jgi:predicted AAA+ superfamily ATPase
VSRECQVGRKAVEGYLEILEDLLLSFRVPVFSKRAKRLVSQHPKFYYFDAGVFRTLRPSGPLDRAEEIEGMALEGLVAQHLRAFCDLDERGFSLFFWRTKAGLEVDFILYGASGVVAIEVKRTSRLRGSDLSGLKAFKADYPMAKTILLYGGKDRLRMGDVRCIPCESFFRNLRPGMDWEVF